MRVLLLHNRYRAEGGEERAVENLASLLSQRGHSVELLERSSTGLPRSTAARGLLRGGIDPEEVTRVARRLRPEVVHAHNLHPLFGWRALAAARAAGARTVLHLHNFRLFCAIAVAFHDGAPCFRCSDGDTRPGLRLRCRGSVPEAVTYAVALRRQYPRLLEYSDRFVAVSDATATRLVELGLPQERTVALANFVPQAGFADRSRAERGRYALVAGRLVQEKGFDTAISAARAAGVRLLVVGEGPEEARLREQSAGAEISFTGRVSQQELAALRAEAAVVLVPSRWEEPCPYSVLDALAAGVPVLVSDRGGLPELAGAASVLPADDPDAWARALAALWEDPLARLQRGEAALTRARERFSEDRYYDELMRLYGCVP